MTAKLTQALCGFYADVSTIHKDSKGNFGKYADLATVLSAVNPALAKNGLAVVQTFDYTETEQLLVTTLLHTSGESISSRLPLVISKGRNPLHDWGGATTYQRRYALLALLNLAAGIEDDDGEGAAPTAPAPTAKKSPTPTQRSAPVAKTETQPAAPKGVVFLTDEEAAEAKRQVRALPADVREAFVDSFKRQFELPAGLKTISDRIQYPVHAAFIADFISSLPES